MNINSNQLLKIQWNGKTVFVNAASVDYCNIFKTTAYEDENMTIRVWDERLNRLFESREQLEKRVAQLSKRIVA